MGRLVGFGRLGIHLECVGCRFHSTEKNVWAVFHRQKRLLWDTVGTRKQLVGFPPATLTEHRTTVPNDSERWQRAPSPALTGRSVASPAPDGLQ
jgi:hypothetical protein